MHPMHPMDPPAPLTVEAPVSYYDVNRLVFDLIERSPFAARCPALGRAPANANIRPRLSPKTTMW